MITVLGDHIGHILGFVILLNLKHLTQKKWLGSAKNVSVLHRNVGGIGKSIPDTPKKSHLERSENKKNRLTQKWRFWGDTHRQRFFFSHFGHVLGHILAIFSCGSKDMISKSLFLELGHQNCDKKHRVGSGPFLKPGTSWKAVWGDFE